MLESVNLSLQGAVLILMLVVIGLLAWKGFENIFDRFSGWTYAAFAAIALTILIAAPVEKTGSIIVGINGRFIGEVLLLAAVGVVAARSFTKDELSGWVWETWKFVKQIFPLLIIGVFAAGIVKVIIPETWVRTLAGQNTISANLVGVIFGVFMYFPTLVEVPIAKMFLDLGMARGPLLAYLLADPEVIAAVDAGAQWGDGQKENSGLCGTGGHDGNRRGLPVWHRNGSALGVPKDNIDVPFLISGDRYLIGVQAIEGELPGLVDWFLENGGNETFTIPEFSDNLQPSQSVTGTPVPGEPCPSCEVFSMDALSPTMTAIAVQLTQSAGQPPQSGEAGRAAIYMFWGDGCPHCAAAKPFLQELDQSSEQIDLRMYEVWYVEENQVLFTNMAAALGFEPHSVPTIFIGDRYWEGYSDQIKSQIQAAVDACLVDGCTDAGVGIIPGVVAPEKAPEAVTAEVVALEPGEKQIDLPIFGSIDLSVQPLFISTLLIAFVDGFNPCSIWVLTMLLALTLHTGSRKKILLIGLIFLTVTAAIYGLFITGLFTMFKVVSFASWIQILVALVALFFALVNIKDYFWYKEGVSFTISDEKKPGIFQRMRRLMDGSQSFWGLVGGTVVLAAGVSLVEFSCTAGFPVLWTNLLVSQNVLPLTFVMLLLVYLLIYQLDELAIFFIAVFTMRASRLEEKQGRILKLIGGVLMLALAGVMLVNPALMNNLTSSLIVFGSAFAVTLIILLVHRTILPRFGVQFGTENRRPSSRKQKRRR
jgi:glutaredoxin